VRIDWLIRGLRVVTRTDGDNRMHHIQTSTPGLKLRSPILMSGAGRDPHNRSPKAAPSDADDEDQVTKMLRKTGCLEVNTALQVSMIDMEVSS
jgi:hypothetical protein